MKYEARLIEEKKRYWIVNENTFTDHKEVEPNLTNNELIIGFLYTKDCPLGKTCINLIPGANNIDLSTFCKHLKGYPIKENEKQFNQLNCNYNGDNEGKFYDVTLLNAINCSDDQANCIECESLSDVNVKPHPEKSHCHVVCGAVKMET